MTGPEGATWGAWRVRAVDPPTSLEFTDAFAEVMEDASKGSGLMWDFGRTLVKQAIKN